MQAAALLVSYQQISKLPAQERWRYPNSMLHGPELKMRPGLGNLAELRRDFSAQELRSLALACSDPKQARRLQALAVILDGGSVRAAATSVGVTPPSISDWVKSFNLNGPDGLISRKHPGRAPTLNDKQRQAFASGLPVPLIAARTRTAIVRQGSLRGLSGSKTTLLHMSQHAPALGVGSSGKKHWTYLIFGRTALWFAALRFPYFSDFDISSG